MSKSISKTAFSKIGLSSIVLAPITLFLPSNFARVDIAKLTLLGTAAATFFLFTGKMWFPGGASQFISYAEAIIHGTTLPATVAQRDAGYPLLIILSGYPLLNSIIPILLMQAAFAVALPLLVYGALQQLSSPIAFYSELAGIATLSPFYFMKMIHHDQTYIFFSMLMLCLLLIFVQTKNKQFLYGFTIAAILASVSRPAGNALFPIFLIISYFAVRGSIRHYIFCLLLFGVFLAGYSWHRYIIFDMKDAKTTPSYTGEQLFYDPYVSSFDYGIRLSPEKIGPNFALAVKHLRDRLQPNPRASRFISERYVHADAQPSMARQFAEENIYPFTTDQLIDRILTHANWEYYLLLCGANSDRLMLDATFEIAKAHPDLILKYFVRNLIHFIFNPGYKHSRYNLNPFSPEGLFFLPAVGDVSRGAASLPPRVFRELKFNSLSRQPVIIRNLFESVRSAWKQYYTRFGGHSRQPHERRLDHGNFGLCVHCH